MNKGFTLIEILVTVVIMAMLGLVITQSFITTIGANTKTEIMKDIKQNGDFAVEAISRQIRNAKQLDCSAANRILTTNQDGSMTLFRSVEESGVCRIAQLDTDLLGTVTTTYLTTTNLTLEGAVCADSALAVTCTQIASWDAEATFTFSLKNLPSASKKTEMAAQKFTTTVSMRNIRY